MRKLNQTLLIIGVLCMAIPSFAQTTLVQWPLDNANGVSATNYSTYIDPASDFTRGNGIGIIGVSADGASARGWYADTLIGIVDYYEVCITPKSGVFLEIDALKFDESRTVGGPKTYEVHWSIDGFITSKQIDSTVIAENDITTRSRNLSGIGLSLCDGQELCFRLYGYNASAPTATWEIEDGTLLIEGNVPSTCTPPASQAPTLMLNAMTSSMDISIQDGLGSARLIVVKEGGPVTGIPCSGNTYAADVIFGMGDQIENGEYVVYAGASTGPSLTDVTVTGLSEGKTYYVSVFEYYSNSLCYLQTNPTTENVVTSCNLPDEIISPLSSIANEEISFSWSAPYCYDDVLIIVGLVDSVVGTPTGNGSDYTPNTVYGSGTDAGGNFTGDEYPVYLGSGSDVTITGLTANTNYFLKVFTRLGTDWSSGVDILVSTATGCTELNGDVVFLNELHYNNTGIDEDEGIEIAGPTGVNLAAYEVHFYEKTTSGTCVHYRTVPLSGIIDNEDGTYGAVWFPIADIEDDPGAVAIYNALTSTLVQFLSYRNNNLVAIDGVASGETADPMNHTLNGVGAASENSGTAIGSSLQLNGFGPCPSNSTHYWGAATETMGKFNANQALPVEFISFTAKKAEKEVLLQWQTATELDNDYFSVERSRNGRDFTSIGNVQGAGTSFEIQQYSLKDKSPYEGNNYYRLRQVDFNGQYTLSKIIVINFKSNNQKEISVYPTMTSSYLNVKFSPIRGEGAQLEIIDLNGRIILNQELQKGSKSYILQTNELNKGHYILRIQQNEYSNIARFVKM